jgi:hypothetical protein
MIRTSGTMGEGNWSVPLSVDEKGDQQQQDALGAIYNGQAGCSIMGHFSGPPMCSG